MSSLVEEKLELSPSTNGVPLNKRGKPTTSPYKDGNEWKLFHEGTIHRFTTREAARRFKRGENR